MDPRSASFCVERTATIRDALEAITANLAGAVAIVSEDGALLGVLSDGDVRRGLIHSSTLLTPVEKVMNTHPITLAAAEEARAAEIFARETAITILPVVDGGNKVVRVLTRYA